VTQPESVEAEASVLLRIVSWNMNHRRQPTRRRDTRAEAWVYLRDELKADAALLQETVPDPSIDRASVIYREIAVPSLGFGDRRPAGPPTRGGLGGPDPFVGP
jgi:hypothetical protein